MLQRKVVTIHQPEHMPWTGFFHKMMLADHYVILDSVQYRKGYFHNRNKVINKNGNVSYITVPCLVNDGKWRNPISKIEVDFSRDWRQKYLGTIYECYTGFPNFSDVYPAIEKIINECPVTLCELNMQIIYFFRELLDISTPISFSSGQPSSLGASELLVELCKSNNATTYLAGPSGKDYLNEDLFVSDNISVDYHQFTAPTYDMDVFSPGLSTLDLIMRFGPRAAEIIQSGGTGYE